MNRRFFIVSWATWETLSQLNNEKLSLLPRTLRGPRASFFPGVLVLTTFSVEKYTWKCYFRVINDKFVRLNNSTIVTNEKYYAKWFLFFLNTHFKMSTSSIFLGLNFKLILDQPLMSQKRFYLYRFTFQGIQFYKMKTKIEKSNF